MSKYFEEAFFYFVFSVMLTTFFSLVWAMLTLPLSVPKGIHVWLRRISPVVAVFILAVIAGAAVDTMWFGLFHEKLYHMGDPLFHFSPFVPFGWWSLDRACGGHLIGTVQMWQLRGLWFVCASAVWVLSIYVYKALRTRINAEQVVRADQSSCPR